MALKLKCIQHLMKENELGLIRERRAADRKPFVRPIILATGRNQDILVDGFSRDLSGNGMGIVTRTNWRSGARALLTIHSLSKGLVRVSAEVRWCEEFGEGWYLSGWNFLDEI